MVRRWRRWSWRRSPNRGRKILGSERFSRPLLKMQCDADLRLAPNGIMGKNIRCCAERMRPLVPARCYFKPGSNRPQPRSLPANPTPAAFGQSWPGSAGKNGPGHRNRGQGGADREKWLPTGKKSPLVSPSRTPQRPGAGMYPSSASRRYRRTPSDKAAPTGSCSEKLHTYLTPSCLA
jgi:hypothetical protein